MIRDGKDAALLTLAMSEYATKPAVLENEVIRWPITTPFPQPWMRFAAWNFQEIQRIITVEDGSVMGGMARRCLSSWPITDTGAGTRLGVPDHFIEQVRC